MEKIGVGIIGLGARGLFLMDTILACEEAEIVAICDSFQEKCEKGIEKVKQQSKKIPAVYNSYEEMLQDKKVKFIVIASSWDDHIRQAIQAMRAGKIAAMEVGGVYAIEECWDLVRTYEETKSPFILLENCCFDHFELLSTALVRANKLGEIVHCHGAYSHDLREELLYANHNYRLGNYVKRNAENYPTHELGPIAKLLDINRGNRMLSLVSLASKACGLEEYANLEKEGSCPFKGLKSKQGDIVSTIITCANGETITLTLDTTLPKHYSREFTVRGTKGYCLQETNMVMIEGDGDLHEFPEPYDTVKKRLGNAEEYKKYLPSEWQNITKEERELGHGGMDYIMFKRIFQCIIQGKELPIDVYDAASWICISILSEQSVAQGGLVQSIPDFTKGKWLKRQRLDVMEFPNI